MWMVTDISSCTASWCAPAEQPHYARLAPVEQGAIVFLKLNLAGVELAMTFLKLIH